MNRNNAVKVPGRVSEVSMKSNVTLETKNSLPTEQELKAKLPLCPNAGSGVHRYLWRAACILWEHCTDESTIERLVTEAVEGCGRDVTSEEIWNAVANSSPELRLGAERFP